MHASMRLLINEIGQIMHFTSHVVAELSGNWKIVHEGMQLHMTLSCILNSC